MSQIFIPITTKTWEGADVKVGVQAPRGAPGGTPSNLDLCLAEPQKHRLDEGTLRVAAEADWIGKIQALFIL